MEAEYLREQESESAGASGFSQLEDKVMKTAAQFLGRICFPMWVSRAGLPAWHLQSMSIWRCAGWKKTLILS